MEQINLIASRHSAFYSPLISCIAGGFLEKHGLEGTYRPAEPGENSAVVVAEGGADVGQSAVSGSWTALAQGKKPPVAQFAQINRFDGFIIAAREPDSSFTWEKLKGRQFLHVHGGQPEAMLRYGLHKEGINLDDLDDLDSPGGPEMMRQWSEGQGYYFHEQGAFPQQLEYVGTGHIVASVGRSVGPVAFSSLVGRWDWLDSDKAKRFTAAYRESRNWVNTADPMEVAKAEASFFPDMAVEATAAAVEFYQELGTWSGDITIEPDLYEAALDVFAHSKLIDKRYAYGDVVVPPPSA